MMLEDYPSSDKLIEAALGELVHKRLIRRIRRSNLLLGASDVVIGGLPQIAEILSKHRVLDLDTG
jgi:hypothetical protein